MKITFAVDEEAPDLERSNLKQELQSLVEKIRSRFRVAIMSGQMESTADAPVIAVASLAHSEESLARQLDSICEFCESSGFGRIDSERTLLDHIDSFGEDDDEDDDDEEPFDRSH